MDKIDDNNNIPGVYEIVNTTNDKRYIGSAKNIQKRLKDHKYHLQTDCHPNKHLQAAWNKYGEESFVFQEIEWVENISNLIEREQYWMDQFLPDEKYNLRPKAENNLGYKPSPEIKEKTLKNRLNAVILKKFKRTQRNIIILVCLSRTLKKIQENFQELKEMNEMLDRRKLEKKKQWLKKLQTLNQAHREGGIGGYEKDRKILYSNITNRKFLPNGSSSFYCNKSLK